MHPPLLCDHPCMHTSTRYSQVAVKTYNKVNESRFSDSGDVIECAKENSRKNMAEYDEENLPRADSGRYEVQASAVLLPLPDDLYPRP